MSVLLIKNLCWVPWISQAQSSWLPESFCQFATLYMYSIRGESHEFHCSMTKSVKQLTNVVGRSVEFVPLAFGYIVLKIMLPYNGISFQWMFWSQSVNL